MMKIFCWIFFLVIYIDRVDVDSDDFERID